MKRLPAPKNSPESLIAAAACVVIGLTSVAPAGACLLAKRLAVVAPHLSKVEIELYAHGNMDPQMVPYTLTAATACTGGQADIYSCDGVDLLDHLNLSEIGGGNGNDLWGWTDPVTGAEIALVGRTNGTAFVDVSDPENAVYLGNLPSHSGTSSWRDIKTFADHAFIVADGQPHGIQVFDLTQLRGISNPPVTFSATAHYGAIGSAHNIVINEATGFAYAVGSNSCSGGLYMVDVNTPTQPTFAGCFSSDGYTHDAQCVIYNGPDTDHTGKEICFASNEDTLTIVDVTNKNNPVQLSRNDYTTPGGSHYAHQGWLTADQRHFVFDDEFDEVGQGHNTRTYVYDVSDLDAPVLNGHWDAAGSSIDHNQYILGNLTYQANYTRGLRILELTDLSTASFTEVGFFDTYPNSNGNSYNGAWSTYPFFASGIVIVSDINRGLFILQPSFGCSVDADCDDGVSCTTDTCNQTTSTCENVADDGLCDNGQFCDGAETCDPVLDCQPGSDPCGGGACDEVADLCTTVCGDGTCDLGEDCNSCSADCPSFPISGATCGNGLCEAGDGEDCVNCAQDCAGVQSGKPSGRFCCGFGGTNPVGCSDSRCTSGGFACTETPQGGGGSTCCGDLVCEAPEDSSNCELDCGPAPFCGDGNCDPGEDECSCAADCGAPLADEVGFCTDSVDNDCDLDVDCDDADCAADAACVCGERGDPCSSGADCCSGSCKNNGTCR